MVFILAVLLLSTFGLLPAGNWLDSWLAARSMGLVSGLKLWQVTRWITSVILPGVSISILDPAMPELHRPWRRTLPGVAFIVLGWLVSAAGFNLYAEYMVINHGS
jgi:uncharacterized BrkB/YihY/UPF0761 family membrane protein